jgi:hypothetical protein
MKSRIYRLVYRTYDVKIEYDLCNFHKSDIGANQIIIVIKCHDSCSYDYWLPLYATCKKFGCSLLPAKSEIYYT